MYNYSKEKIDIIFERLLKYADKNLKSGICKDSLITIREILIKAFKDNQYIKEFENVGREFYNRGVLFIESISIFDFLRKNFIAHLPNNIDLREAKRVERFFEDIVQYFSKGYLKEYIIFLKEELSFFEKHLISENMIDKLLLPLKNHINFFIGFLDFILEDKTFYNITYKECEFGKWLKESGKIFFKENENIYRDIKKFHKDFHYKIEIGITYKEKSKYKELYSLLIDIENIILHISNEFSYINSKYLALELTRDPLTGVLTRRSFNSIISRLIEIANITELPITLIISDLDFFKKINDTYGHFAGDEALKHFVKIVREKLRKSDYIFRIGGEEFIILLPNTSIEDGVKIAEEIRKALKNTPLKYDNKEIKITATFGVEEIKKNDKLEEIIKKADMKLYKGKKEGRNKVVY